MKKLAILFVFTALGVVAFAQTPTKKEAAKAPATSLSVSQPASAEMEASSSVQDSKKEVKKDCSAEEKKACGTKAGKKSCCSSNAEGKKEETK